MVDEMDVLLRTYSNRLKNVNNSLHRYLFSQIDWEDRLICIVGARGCGKTTLMLQHIKQSFAQTDKALYISLDDLWFLNHDLMDVVEYHVTHGGTHLFLDEVHLLDNWSRAIKNIYDSYPQLNVVYTGSSMLKLDHSSADLSRRQVVYQLVGLSFREYLEFEGVISIPALTLPQLLSEHVAIANSICDKVKILPLFEKYLRTGYYPFYKEVRKGYEQRLKAVINQVLNEDYLVIDSVSAQTIRKTKRMLMVLAEHVPQMPTMNDLYRELETDRNQGMKMLYALERAGLLSLLLSQPKSLKALSKPDKILLDNTNLMYALSLRINEGTLRETFFMNQLKQGYEVSYPQKGDFLVDKKYLFEVGGKNKTFEQIKDIEDSYLAVDDMEIGHHNRIPLWMFGLLY